MKVLVSSGFGAGWSTWADSRAQYELATDEELIRHFENDDREAFEARANAILRTITGNVYDEVYMGGYSGLQVQEVDGDFFISEYDGSERLEHVGTIAWRPSGRLP